MAKSIVTPTFRLGFPTLAEPKSFEGSKPKFSVIMLFDKEDKALLKEMQLLVKEAVEKKWPDPDKRPKNLKTPFRDGDKDETYRDKDGFAGCIFASASSLQRPGTVKANKDVIPKEEIEVELYGGCYCRARLTAYGYDVAGNRGVAFGLQHVQKVKEGQAFSGRMRVEDAFDVIEGEDDPFAIDTQNGSDEDFIGDL